MTSDSSEDGLPKKPPGVAHSHDDGLAILAVSIFLTIIIWTVFGQTIRHGFIDYDDGVYICP